MGGASKLLMLLTTPFPLLYPRPAALRLRLSRPSGFPRAPLSTFAPPHSPLSPPDSSTSAPRSHLPVRAAGDPVSTPSVAHHFPGDLPGANPRLSHPWPEWSRLMDHLAAAGYSGRQGNANGDGDSFTVYEELPAEFVRAAEMCLSFSRDRADLVRLLPKKDIEVIVENGSPFLFKNGVDSARRMRVFIDSQGDVYESEKAHTVDIMRYLLSYASNPLVTSGENSFKATELIEASVRNLLNELVNVSGTVQESRFTVPTPRQPPLKQEQFSRPPGQNIEMKRGDWICSKCSFMNFARNVKCLECNEGRPKRQLTGGEWECPQCDFFNYGRNISCLRCDCKRPGEAPATGTNSGYGGQSSFEQILNRSNTDKSEIERKLAANDEKAERWFSKVSQLEDASDLSRAAADEDFPEIMPLRKGVNRFVVSTRKTPLERRLANAQYETNLGNDGAADRNVSQPGSLSGRGSDRTTESSISQSLDRLLGRPSSSSGADDQSVAGEASTSVGSRFNSSEYRQSITNQRRDPDYVPFVPLPADMFSKSKKSDSGMQQSPDKEDSSSVKANELGDSTSTIYASPTESKIDKESSGASERWSKKVAELDNVTDLANAISDEDFPEIMPMRKGENRFVVSKKKDRSLTSPQYKRRLAMEQANSSNFVPFVPFPPDYFAKKDKQTEGASSTAETATGGSAPVESVHCGTTKLEETKPVDYNSGTVVNRPQHPESSMASSHNTEFSWRGSNAGKMDTSYGGPVANPVQLPGNTRYPGKGFNDGWIDAYPVKGFNEGRMDAYPVKGFNEGRMDAYPGKGFNEGRMDASYGDPSNPVQPSNNSWNYRKDGWTSETTQKNTTYSGSSAPGTSRPAQDSQTGGENWKYSGKSLEGSAVKETDPLDMSEEAKAERWFRRVAQIKDISELSQIPDEDFPEIMPMRKGVNRFVVSKRKTPLERRLTSPQYRRNLPTVSSEPDKENK